MGKLIKIPPQVGKFEKLDPAFKPKQPKFRYVEAGGQWLKIRTADGEEVAWRCSGSECGAHPRCHRYFEIPASRVSSK